MAEEAFQVAVGEEDRPRAAPPHQFRLLAEMGAGAGDDQIPPGAAGTGFAARAVGAAGPGADPAGCQEFLGFLGPPLDLG